MNEFVKMVYFEQKGWAKLQFKSKYVDKIQ